MVEIRLGDIIDDFCVKCRRLTNHSVVSIVEDKPAKVRCRTCYNDHDYRNEQAPPSKKELKKAALFNEVLANMQPSTPGDSAEAPATEAPATDPPAAGTPATTDAPETTAEEPKPKKTRGRKA